MTVTINGTTGVSGVAGSASTPALVGSDADSGYYINSANEPNASVNGTAVWSAASTFGFKNRIINPGMVIDQRNAGASVSISGSNNAYSVDRWNGFQSTDGAFTLQQVSDAPAGFINSLKFTTTTADASLGATQWAAIRQNIEGLNTFDFSFGTASAKSVTVSFWVKSSLTGTFGGALLNSAEDRSYPFTYAISSANTWEQKSVTITGDTSGTWLTTNGVGMRLVFGLGVGSTYSGTANAWTGSSFIYSVTGATSVIGTLNATWQITGVQLEKGSTATSFDFRSIGTELQLCQRYYEKNYDLNVAVGTNTPTPDSYSRVPLSMRYSGVTYTSIPYKVPKRATPSLSFWGTTGTVNSWSAYANGGGTSTLTPTYNDGGQYNLNLSISGSSSYDLCQGYWASSAEL